MPPLSPAFLIFFAATLLFGFLNGLTDSANIVAPVVSARALSPRRTRLLATAALCVAPFIFGVAVARTIGTNIVAPQFVTLPIVVAAALSATGWTFFTWRAGIPSSSSHALVGGLVGATLAGAGWPAVHPQSITKVLVALFFSPVIGLLVGYLLTQLIYWLTRSATPRINNFFRQGQVVTALALAFSYGANDAQKTMGLLALGLAAATGQPFTIPLWVIGVAIASIALGTLTGSRRMVRKLGMKFYRIRPVHGLAAQLAAASVIFGAAFLGGPVSTTQVVSTAILGAGAAERVNQVRWGVVGEIVWAWVLTIPATSLVSAGLFILLKQWL
jgi:PiT family inorganic phosphate transporter